MNRLAAAPCTTTAKTTAILVLNRAYESFEYSAMVLPWHTGRSYDSVVLYYITISISRNTKPYHTSDDRLNRLCSYYGHHPNPYHIVVTANFSSALEGYFGVVALERMV